MSDDNAENIELNSNDPLVTVTYKDCNFSFFYDDHGIGGWYTASHRPRCSPFAYTKGIKVPICDPTSNANLWQLLSALALEQGVKVTMSSSHTKSDDDDGDEDAEGKPAKAKKTGKVSLSKSAKKLNGFTKLF
jgi:hypothetical protein